MKIIKTILMAVVALLLVTSFTPANEWYKLDKKEFGFKIEFPKKPKTVVWRSLPEVNMFCKTYEFHSTFKHKKGDNRYWVYYTQYPDLINNSDKMNKKELEKFYQKRIQYYILGSGDKILSEQAITLKGYSGKELKLDVSNLSYAYNGEQHTDIVRMFLVKNNLYIIQASVDPKTGLITSSMNHFLDSFDLL